MASMSTPSSAKGLSSDSKSDDSSEKGPPLPAQGSGLDHGQPLVTFAAVTTFTGPVRSPFTPGRPIIPVATVPSSPKPTINPQTVISKMGPVSRTEVTSTSGSAVHPAPIPSTMSSLIRGTSPLSTVQTTYSSHVPRGAAAVACITALKPAVATPIPRAPHVFNQGVVSSTSMHPTMQSRSATSTTITRAAAPVVSKPNVPISESGPRLPSRPTIGVSSTLAAPTQLLITGPRPPDTSVRPTIVHASVQKSHPIIQHIQQQLPEKGYYKQTVLTVPSPISNSVVSAQQSIVPHHGAPQLLSIQTPVNLAAQTHNVSSSTSKVIAQTLQTVPQLPHLQASGNVITATSTNRPNVVTTTVTVTSNGARPVTTSTSLSAAGASIPVAKVYPQTVTARQTPSESSQHIEALRSGTTLFVPSTQQKTSPGLTTATVTTTAVVSTLPSGVILSDSRTERSSASYSFPTGTTAYYYEPMPVQSTLTVHPIATTPGAAFASTLPAPALRTGLLSAHQTVAVPVRAATPSTAATVSVNPTVMVMSTPRTTVVVPSGSGIDNEVAPVMSLAPSSPFHSSTIAAFPTGSPSQHSSAPNLPSSPRPSILRKRTADGAAVAVKKTLLSSFPAAPTPAINRSELTSTSSASNVTSINTTSSIVKPSVTPSKDSVHENGQSSESTDSSCNGVHPPIVNVKQEPIDHTETCEIASAPAISAANSAAIEASPRKKPRKQQLTGKELVETHSTEGEDEFEKESKEIIKREIIQEDEDGVRWVSYRKRPPFTLLHSYRHTWKSRHNHFLKYADVKTKDERKPTVDELANQKGVVQKAGGWKVYHICTQLEDLVDLEDVVHARFSSVLETLEHIADSKDKEDVDLNQTSEILRGSLQRCKLIRDQMKDAKQQVLKVLDHKARVVEIVDRYATKKTNNSGKRHKN